MYSEHELVALGHDLPDTNLVAGDLGLVVGIYDGSDVYEIEFITLTGETVAVVTLAANDLRPTEPGEIAHARRVA